jgi:hypothetical protein
MKILSLLMAVLLSCGASTASAACRPRPGDTDAVVKTMQDFFDAAARDDLDKFHDLVLGSFYPYDGGKRWEGDSLMRALIEWHRQGMKLAWSVNDAEVHVDCDMAWIASALAAAPPSIASGASVIARDASGADIVLRQGNNG